MLAIKCPDCDYQDQGYDTDLIMTAYRRHKIECTGQRAGFFIPERENTLSKYTPITEIVRAKYRYPGESSVEDAEFDRWLNQIKADSWDEGYRDGHSDGLSDGHPLFNGREPEENPYREANDD